MTSKPTEHKRCISRIIYSSQMPQSLRRDVDNLADELMSLPTLEAKHLTDRKLMEEVRDRIAGIIRLIKKSRGKGSKKGKK